MPSPVSIKSKSKLIDFLLYSVYREIDTSNTLEHGGRKRFMEGYQQRNLLESYGCFVFLYLLFVIICITTGSWNTLLYGTLLAVGYVMFTYLLPYLIWIILTFGTFFGILALIFGLEIAAYIVIAIISLPLLYVLIKWIIYAFDDLDEYS